MSLQAKTSCYDYSQITPARSAHKVKASFHLQPLPIPTSKDQLQQSQIGSSAMLDSMEIMDEVEKEHISRLHDVLSKLVFWKRRSSIQKKRSMVVKSTHSTGVGKHHERSRSSSSRSHRLFERKRSFRTESTVSSHSPISQATTSMDVDDTILSTSMGWWGEEEPEDHISLLPSSRRNEEPTTNNNEEEGEEYDAFEYTMEPFWVTPGIEAQEEEEKKEEPSDLNPRQLLEELEVLSHAISVAQSEGDGMTAEELASIEEHVSVWLRVRERIRSALQGVFRKKNSPSSPDPNKAKVLPKFQKEPRCLEAENIPPPPPPPPPIPAVLQLNPNGADGVEVQFPLFAEGDVDVSRIEETTLNDLETDFGCLDAQRTTKGSLEQDDTEVSVAMDPVDQCVQLVLVRSEDESARHTRSSSGNGHSDESSLLLNDFSPTESNGALGAAFPFRFDLEDDENQQSVDLDASKVETDLSQQFLTPERPKAEDPPILTRTEADEKEFNFHDLPDDPSTPSSPGEAVSRRKVQNLFMDDPQDEDAGNSGPFRNHLSSQALRRHDSSIENGPPTVIKPDIETATVSTLTHRRAASSDNVWAEIVEAKNDIPFDEPSHEDKAQEHQQNKGQHLIKMVQENFFQPIVRYAQEDFMICGSKHPDSPTKKFIVSGSAAPPSPDVPESIPAEGLDSSFISSLTHPRYVPEPGQEEDVSNSKPSPTSRLEIVAEIDHEGESGTGVRRADHDHESVLSAFDPTDFSNYASAAAESNNYDKGVSVQRRHRSTVSLGAQSKVSV